MIKKREEYRNSKAKNKRVYFYGDERVQYFENNVSILNAMYLKSGYKISNILENEEKSSVVLQNVLESHADCKKVEKIDDKDFSTKYTAGNSLDEEFYQNGTSETITSRDKNESVNKEVTDNNNEFRYVKDRFKEYKIVYECDDNVDNRARGLAALQRLCSADIIIDRNWL